MSVNFELDELESRAKIIVEDFSGIFSPYDAFYIHSIIYSASRCLEAFEHYEFAKEKQADSDYLISLVQEAIGHAAALSRYFWPVWYPGKLNKTHPYQAALRKKRGEKLISAFGMEEDSPIHNRDLRNAWEHFDENLDDYLLKNDAGHFFPDSAIGNHTLADEPTYHLFKLLDPEAECLVLMGKKYFFGPIKSEVGRVYDRANYLQQNGYNLRPL
ncbi:hypothetical protein NMS58_001797 [Vibrio cholerae]|nr:hypothetical protein [Vibrio cholerae]